LPCCEVLGHNTIVVSFTGYVSVCSCENSVSLPATQREKKDFEEGDMVDVVKRGVPRKEHDILLILFLLRIS
jgi:hypothetical protein